MRSESGWAIWSPRDGLLIQTVRKTSEDAWCAMLKSVGFEREAWERDGFRAEQVTVSTFLCGPPYPSNANLRAEAESAEAVREACAKACEEREREHTREMRYAEAVRNAEDSDCANIRAQEATDCAAAIRSLPMPAAHASAVPAWRDSFPPTHYCRECKALWRRWPDGSWSLVTAACGKCCDNVPMGEQIAPLASEYPTLRVERPTALATPGEVAPGAPNQAGVTAGETAPPPTHTTASAEAAPVWRDEAKVAEEYWRTHREGGGTDNDLRRFVQGWVAYAAQAGSVREACAAIMEIHADMMQGADAEGASYSSDGVVRKLRRLARDIRTMPIPAAGKCLANPAKISQDSAPASAEAAPEAEGEAV